MNRTTPPKVKKDELKSTTPKMPVRLSSSISNLISTSSLTSICKERSLSCSLSQATNDLFHPKTIGENDEVNIMKISLIHKYFLFRILPYSMVDAKVFFNLKVN